VTRCEGEEQDAALCHKEVERLDCWNIKRGFAFFDLRFTACGDSERYVGT